MKFVHPKETQLVFLTQVMKNGGAAAGTRTIHVPCYVYDQGLLIQPAKRDGKDIFFLTHMRSSQVLGWSRSLAQARRAIKALLTEFPSIDW